MWTSEREPWAGTAGRMTHGATGKPRPWIVVGISGASGAAYGVRAVELLAADPSVECHVVVSPAGGITLRDECGLSVRDVHDMADVKHAARDIGASIASGSSPVSAMLVAPCSVNTLSAIAYSRCDELIPRAADVSLKEGRPLLLMLRETPLHLGHLQAMTAATQAGAIVAPPVPALYAKPACIADIVDHTVRRALDRVGLSQHAPPRWNGVGPNSADTKSL